MPDNAFRQFHEAGYCRLVPVTPPDARVSERSSLFMRRNALGKAPGVKGPDGLWRGIDWLKLEPTEADLDAWHEMGAGVGVRMGDGLVCLDIDTLDKDLGDICGTTATKILGASVNRVGQAPKRAKLYRVSEPVAYQRLKFDGGHVELLSDDRQVVVKGVHPKTGQPYTWRDGVPKFDSLPLITPAQINDYFNKLAKALPKATIKAPERPAERATVDQGQLTGSREAVQRAVVALPNTTALFPSYDDYIRVGYAIKGATQDDPALGLDLFQAWAAKWPEGNDPGQVAADWQRMKPPFSVGAQYLYHLAEKHGGFSTAETWFQPIAGQPTDQNAFEIQQPPLEPIVWRRPSEWSGEPPERQWDVKDWIPRGEVVLLYGEGGVGKTLLAHQYAICAATGTPWLGQPTRPAKVMCFFCEDSDDELHRRHVDISRSLGVEPSASDARLRIASRKYADNLLALWERNSGAMRRTAVWEQLRSDALLFGADVIIVDTLADTFGGSEIDRSQVNSFVKSCLGKLAQEVGCTVIALGHPSVGGRAEGRSGSTAWSNAARARMYLRYPGKEDTGNVRDLVGMKLNYGPKGAQIKLRWERGAFSAIAASSPIDLNAFKNGGVPTINAAAEAVVLQAWAAADYLELSIDKRARYLFAPTLLRAALPGALTGYTDEEILAALQRLVKAGRAIPADRRRLAHVAPEPAAGVFN